MKDGLLKLLLCGFVLVMGSSCAIKNEEDYSEEKFMIGNTLDDGRVIHFAFDVPYGENGLSSALSDKDITIEEFIDKLDYISTLRDGGSNIYKYNRINKEFGTENFYVIECNSLDNIKDIYVAKYKKNLEDKCTIKIDDLDGVSMTIKDGTLTKTGVTVIIHDTSDRENIYGDEYRIDKKINNEWEELEIVFEGNYAWNSIGYTVGADNILEFDINWKTLYGKLDKGEYRIVKDTLEAGEGTSHYITVEFVIE